MDQLMEYEAGEGQEVQPRQCSRQPLVVACEATKRAAHA